MPAKPIREWLSEYKSLTDEQVHTFASTVRENKELIESLYKLFEQKPSVEELDPVCHQLFEFYRSKEENLKRFALELVPTTIWLYLTCLSQNDKKSCGGLEAFLLGIYNLEIVNSDGTAKVKTFRIPSMAQSSVYHDPLPLSALSLTESALNRYNRHGDVWRGGPYPQSETINGQNRQAVLCQLVQVYNADISNLTVHSLEALCQAASRICLTGLPSLHVSPLDLQSWPPSNGPRPKMFSPSKARYPPRISVSPALLVEILWGISFALYNGCDKSARKAVQDVHARATFELLPDVLLMTEAILNSDLLNLGLGDAAGPMGITVASAGGGLAKGVLTNASFKTKKLPEDIVVVEEQQTASTRLSPIEEENRGLTKHILRLSKGRTKSADKEKTRSREIQRKDSDTSSIKSLSMNGSDGLAGSDALAVAVVKNQNKVVVDALELRPLNDSTSLPILSTPQPIAPTSTASASTPVINGNNSAAHKGGSGGPGVDKKAGGEGSSRPSSMHGVINPDSYSTDL